jgi:hypothetical protein
VGEAFGTRGRGDKSLQGFGEKTDKQRDHSENLGVDERVGSEWILGALVEGLWSG